VSKSISEFKGEPGCIYVEEAQPGDGHRYEVWFETFCILGEGNSEIEALRDAARYTKNIHHLITGAIAKTECVSSVGASAGE
jgi:hypothetical protein